MKKYIIVIVVISLVGCTSEKITTEYTALSQKEFLNNPFGFKENIKNFTNSTRPIFSSQKLLRKNQHYPEKTDTIYQFTYKNSEIFFYKTHLGKEFLLAGKVLNKQIKLKNGIYVGITKSEFINKFTDELNFNADSLVLNGEGTKYTFLFDKGKLQRINIDNYFD
ncbi:MAG: hypothetical protein KOO66_04745 [Bacteroidales bacterium]|nr:hypothetical protein [Bacteroidales bacterium]